MERLRRWLIALAIFLAVAVVVVGGLLRVQRLGSANRFLSAQVTNLSADHAVLSEEVGFLTGLRHRLASQLALTEEARKRMEARNFELTDERDTLVLRVEELGGEVDIMVDKLTARKLEIAAMERTAREREARIRSLETEKEDLVVVNFELREELDSARRQIAELSDEQRYLQTRIETLTERKQALEAMVDGLGNRAAILTEENIALHSQLTALQNELALREAEIVSLRQRGSDDEESAGVVAITGGGIVLP